METRASAEGQKHTIRYTPLFLAHLSRQLKWLFLIVCRLSSVRHSVNFSHFHLQNLQNRLANFNKTWHKPPLGELNSIYSNEGPRPFPTGHNNEKAKIFIRRNFEIFRTMHCGNFFQNWHKASLDKADSALNNKKRTI